jgi:hypothetical protein
LLQRAFTDVLLLDAELWNAAKRSGDHTVFVGYANSNIDGSPAGQQETLAFAFAFPFAIATADPITATQGNAYSNEATGD